MALGPIEILVFAFGREHLDGSVLPEVRKLVESGTVRIVDALLARRDAGGALSSAELGAADAELSALIDHLEGLIADEDVAELCAGLAPGQTALVVAFENTWLRPLLAAVRDAGGEVLSEVAVPEQVVQRVADEVPDEE